MWRGLKKVFELFKILTRVKVGAHSKVNFWNEKCYNEKRLSELFPNIFRKCFLKNGKICEFLSFDRVGNPIWELNLPRRLADREFEEVISIMNILNKTMVSGESDSFMWQDGGDWFSVRVCFVKIQQFRRGFFKSQGRQLDWRQVWNTKVPPRVNFLCGFLCTGRSLLKWSSNGGASILLRGVLFVRFKLKMQDIFSSTVQLLA